MIEVKKHKKAMFGIVFIFNIGSPLQGNIVGAKRLVTLADTFIRKFFLGDQCRFCLLYTSPSPRDATLSRMPSSA